MAALDTIGIGSTANDGTGDPLRTAFGKINDLINAAKAAGWTTLGPAKPTVRAATTTTLASNTYTSGVLTASANGALGAIDGMTLIAGQRLLVKDEASGLKNGVYVVTQVGDGSTPYILTRADDFSTWDEIVGRSVYVEEGSTQADRLFFSTADAGGTLGTTAITYALGAVSNITAAIWGYLAGITLFVGSLLSAANARSFCALLGIWHTLDASAVQVVRSSVNGAGDATETAQVTIAIPAGAMGPNGRLRLTWLGSQTSSANGKTWRVRFGASGAGVGGTPIYNNAATNNASIHSVLIIRNRNNAAQQVSATSASTTAFNQVNAAVTTLTIDTTAATEIVISNLWAGATSGEAMNVEDWQVEVLYKA